MSRAACLTLTTTRAPPQAEERNGWYQVVEPSGWRRPCGQLPRRRKRQTHESKSSIRNGCRNLNRTRCYMWRETIVFFSYPVLGEVFVFLKTGWVIWSSQTMLLYAHKNGPSWQAPGCVFGTCAMGECEVHIIFAHVFFLFLSHMKVH